MVLWGNIGVILHPYQSILKGKQCGGQNERKKNQR